MADVKQQDPNEMVEFLTYQDRYLYGKYVRATPEAPAVVLMPACTKESALLKRKKPDVPVEEAAQKLEPHFNSAIRGASAPAAHTRDVKVGRASDREPSR